MNHRPIRREIDGEFEQERFVVLHSVEIPAQTERIERRMKNIIAVAQVDRKRRAQVALGAHRPANYALVVAEGFDIEFNFDVRPLLTKFGIGADGNFVLGILGLCLHQIFVGAGLDMEFVVRHLRPEGLHISTSALSVAEADELRETAVKWCGSDINRSN